jgi:integrase
MESIGSEIKKETKKNKRTRGNGHGTIFFNKQRKSWTAQIHDIHGVRRISSFKSKVDSETWLVTQKLARDRGEGLYALHVKQNVAEFLDDWLQRRKTRIRPNSYRAYEQTILHRINPYIGNLNAAKLKPLVIEDLLAKLIAKEYKPGSIIGVIRVLSKAYNDGVRLELVPVNPMNKVEKSKLESIPLPAIPADDLLKIYALAADDPYDLARLVVGAEIGLRPGEARGLQWSDLDEVRLSIRVERQVIRNKGTGLTFAPTKSKRLSAVPITERQFKILMMHKRSQTLTKAKWTTDLNLIFPNNFGNMMDETKDKAWMKEICKSLSIPPYALYQMRKTAFTELMLVSDAGSTMAFSGHTQASTLFKHYVLPETNAVREAINRREAANPGAHF